MRPAIAALLLLPTIALGVSGCAEGAAAPAACTSNSGAGPTEEERAAERLAMPEPEFWRLIDVLHGDASESAYARLSTALAAESPATIESFQIRLTLALYRLDDQCRADWYRDNDPSGLHWLADDDFLYFRAATVTAGRGTWEEAIRDDTLPWGRTDPIEGEGELLLYAADDAIDRQGGSSEAFEERVADTIGIDYETASNPAGWPPADPDSTSLNRLG